MTAKELKQAAKIKWEHAGMFGYFMSEDQMQAFIQQLCNEYFKKIAESIERDAENDELETLESIIISIGKAPTPEL